MKILKWIFAWFVGVMEEGPLPKQYLFFFVFWSNLLLLGLWFVILGHLQANERTGQGAFFLLGALGWLVATRYFQKYRKLLKKEQNVA